MQLSPHVWILDPLRAVSRWFIKTLTLIFRISAQRKAALKAIEDGAAGHVFVYECIALYVHVLCFRRRILYCALSSQMGCVRIGNGGACEGTCEAPSLRRERMQVPGSLCSRVHVLCAHVLF